MEETSKLQVLKCPACNAKLTYFFEFDKVITCPVCHNRMNSHVLQTVEAHMPLRYVSPTIDVDGFKHLTAQTLVDIDFVPCDVFQAIDAEEVFCIYLPMYLYEGTYQVAGSGIGSDHQQLNGNAKGKLAYLYLANDRKGDLPKELRDFTTCLPYDAEALSSFEAGHIDATDSHVLTTLSTITAEAVWKKWNGSNGGSTMFLRAGEKLSVDELLKGLITVSGNDAAALLAVGIDGSEEVFVKRMNRVATHIGMASSRFGTPSGWPDGGGCIAGNRPGRWNCRPGQCGRGPVRRYAWPHGPEQGWG